jgi:hypothetical protein
MRPETDNRRGMILIAAVPMAAILVGCIWQLNALQAAVLYRESLQDAADATAWESAVLHARGMNAVAALNVVMALLSAVTGLYRAIELLAVITLAGDPLLSAASHADRALSGRIGEALEIASEQQRAVATGTPLLAAIRSAADNGTAYGTRAAASTSLPFSYALLPVAADRELEVDAQKPWLLAPDPQPRAGARLGAEASLPIERGQPDALCARAGAWATQELRPLAERALRDRALARRTRQLASQLDAALDEPLAQLLCGRPEPAAALCSDPAACSQQLQGYAADPHLPARVWSRAENGNVMLQTWSSAHSKGPRDKQLHERALGLLSRRPLALEADRDAFAQAEYYYACPAERQAWAQCQSHALWSLNWRARLRRLWRPDARAPSRIARAFDTSLPALERGLRELGVSDDPRQHLRAFWAAPQVIH